jgi:hypothetical protein
MKAYAAKMPHQEHLLESNNVYSLLSIDDPELILADLQET